MMKRPLLAGCLAGLLGLILGYDFHQPLLYALVAFLTGFMLVTQSQLSGLQRELAQLREALAKDWDARRGKTVEPSAAPASSAAPELSETPGAPVTPESSVTPGQVAPEAASQARQPATATVSGATPVAQHAQSSHASGQKSAIPATPDDSTLDSATTTPSPTSSLVKLLKAVVGWFTDGNLFMRVGIVLLFLGVAFLLKYVSGRGFITIEMRLIAVSIGALAALVGGQRLLVKNRTYALLLQGAAVGVLYLDIYGAYYLYQLLPSTLAFGLLFFVSMLSAALAVLQNAPALAYTGFAGGFLAPLLVSSGSGNHVALFSYYTLLNGAILAVSWFKSWRPLNLLGFYFTFGIAVLWGANSYSPEKFASTEPFLILFFLFYVTLSILNSQRQPTNLRGYVDGSLLFGTPILAFALQLVLVDPYTYGAAWSAFSLGVFYLTLATTLWRRHRQEQRLLVEAFLALGVIFATLVIPFALGEADTAGAWALEGAGLIWLGIRQNRILAKGFGILLQLAAALFWFEHRPTDDTQMFWNSSYLAGVMLAGAGFLSARLYREGTKGWDTHFRLFFTCWFLAWWSGIGLREIFRFAEADFVPAWIVGYFAVSALAVFQISKRWHLPSMQMTTLLLPLPLLLALIYTIGDGFFSSSEVGVPHQHAGGLAWPSGILVYAWILRGSEPSLSRKLLTLGHIALGLIVFVLVQWETAWVGEHSLSLTSSWLVAWNALPSIAALQLIHRGSFWPLSDWPKSYLGGVASTIAVLLGMYLFYTLHLPGADSPLPWLPILNPLDIVTLIGILSLWTIWLDLIQLWGKHFSDATRRFLFFSLTLAGFGWLNVTLFRALHHWRDMPYDLDQLLQSSFTQTALSILWVITGTLLVLVANRLSSRATWISGAVLLAIVVLKLFAQDLANTGSLERIISFLAVGGMLMAIGYFSPLPPRKPPPVHTDNSSRSSGNEPGVERPDMAKRDL